ncbi:MAG: LysE family transporter [Gorillibacterium sp.]|nr:LysE family transporter [Gorillibacterium sp.]
MNVLISHFLLGLSLAIPFGPVNATQMEQGIRRGFLHSCFIGLGSVMADGVFMLLVYFGVVHFLTIPFMKTFLWLFGFFILTYLGIEGLLTISKPNTATRTSEGSLVKSFSTGFLMSISNPLAILFWLGIYGSVLANMIAKYDAQKVLLYSLVVLAPILMWDTFIAIMASVFRRLFTDWLLAGITIASGLSLIGFGLYFGWEAYRVLFG